MSADLASGARPITYSHVRTIAALAGAGFRRYATYRQATAASIFTNTIFGFLRCFVLLAVASAATNGVAGGYDREQLATYCWASQGLIGMVMLWGFSELSERIRSGDVVADLLRPVHPVTAYLAADLGRAAHASLTRFTVPLAVGATFFDIYAPRRLVTYPLFALSIWLGVVVCFGCRYLINATAYWLLDVRGVSLLWVFGTSGLAGLTFPLHFLPSALVWTIWIATPFPSILQAPLDVLVERGSTAQLAGIVAGQAAWAALVLACCRYVQRRAERRLVIQGG